MRSSALFTSSSCAKASTPRPRPSAARQPSTPVCSACKRDAVAEPQPDPSKRALLTALVGSSIALAANAAAPAAAQATALQELGRKFIRPDDLTPVDAVVALMDAKSTLKEIADIAATPQDSQVRFVSRKLWPAFAKTLRAAGPAAPVAAGAILGADKEATLSEEYGGKAGEQPGLADRVYVGLGRVLTISGRTIKPEAQASPDAALEARAAIEDFLSKVPAAVSKEAQDFRVQRAAAAAL